jgi:ATP-dependent DNA helicase RecQ
MSFAPKCLCLDIETAADDALDVRKIAAWRPDTHGQVVVSNVAKAHNIAEQLDALTEGARFVVGHNLLRHDIPVLRQRFPQLRLLALPIVDTLELSPIAFPQNPYHSLVKDYKLVRDTRSDPLKDAQLALKLWQDQFDAFKALGETLPEELACHHYLLTQDPDAGVGSFFTTLRRAKAPSPEEVKAAARNLLKSKVCATRSMALLGEAIDDPARCKPLSYLIAWLRVAGGNSVIPPWVRFQYPVVRELIRELRERPCNDPACHYCQTYLDPKKELERYFGHPAFRPEPPNATGGSLQEDIVRAGYAGKSILAILPTGAGKSICYQLPALSRHWRNGALTIIISPLQSLMKDQVDNLVKLGIYSAATLNGLLSMPERHDVLEKVRLGDVGLLLVSPEQFRNKALVDAIRYREIGTWVFDEAHCLSKWGNDFRPDYLYVSRFIRERYGKELAPVCCFTATAKKGVVADLKAHFKESLGLELASFDGGHERDNLHYEVMPVTKAEKFPLIHRILEQELKDTPGGAIVFAARRKSCEEISDFLKDMGWACAHFHAGLEAGHKKDIQQSFIAGELRVIAATNAFGMGVDKPDVRVVIHAEIPGSLENYLQEAGRAGRDRQASRCILLYDEEDVESQFALTAKSRLTRQDIAGILRTLRRYSAKTHSIDVVVTPGEILADEELETSIEAENPDADTKVRTALAWLERARFLERNENHTRVFPGSLKVGSLEDASTRLARADLSDDMRRKYLDLVSILINADDDEGISTDTLMLQLGMPSEECIRMLHQLETLGILTNDISLTVLLRRGVKDASSDRADRLSRLEATLLDLLPELAPEADGGDWQDMNLRMVCQEVKLRSGADVLPDQLLTLMRSLARPFGEESHGRRAMFDVRVMRRELLRVHLLRSWSNIREIASRRRAAAGVLLQFLLSRLDAHLRGVDLRVECKMGELAAAMRADMMLGPTLKDELSAIEAGLLYLHDNGVLIIDRGKSVFRQAMTIHVFPEEKPRGFTNADYAPLREHYGEKNFQVHVIQEYARLGLKKLSDALSFVLAYFTLPKLDFIRRYFAGRRELLERATTEESYRRIVEELRHPLQQQIVADKGNINRLILAGPGSGKTRVIVHRVAYLLRVLREQARSIVVLTFNRAAAAEVRQRLYALIGNEAAGITVLTYHAMALRLTGTSLAKLAEHGEEITFDRILDDALALLEGRREDVATPEDGDELRDRVLAGYRHILVDEYQDIDASQYALISGLAGRKSKDRDAKLTILAVGDDDQNIYSFRNTSNEFIRRFEQDYEARIDYLVENYRSTSHIIDAANQVIASSADRMKREHPIRVNHARRNEPAGGRWASIDLLATGRVQILEVPNDAIGQAEVAMREIRRLKSLDPGSDWSDFAVLAHNHATLDPIRAWCEVEGIRYITTDQEKGQPRLHQVREGYVLLEMLKTKPKRRTRPAALKRWFEARYGGGRSDNPWETLLSQFIDEIEMAWADEYIPSSWLIDELFEFGNEARRSQRGRIVISTVHGAKGREFRHVTILDGGDWRDASDDERRLYYVGMTRAKENLVLCQGTQRSNLFSPALIGETICRSPLPTTIERRPELSLRYVSLGLKGVDLDFAGRKQNGDPIHRVLASLAVGDPLFIVQQEDRREITTASGVIVGRLAKNGNFPEGKIIRATVESLVRRSSTMVSNPDFQKRLKSESWWVVLPALVIQGSNST